MALIMELTGIVAVGAELEAASIEKFSSGAVNGTSCRGSGDLGSDFNC